MLLLLLHPLHLFFLLLLLLSSLPLNLSKTLPTKPPEYLKLRLHHHLNPSPKPPQTQLFETQKTLKSPVISGASTGSGQYFVDFSIGTPPQHLLLVTDTGSDLVWAKCSACRRNCTRHPPGTAFLARHSTTFSPFHCYDRACRRVPRAPAHCNRTRLHSPCRYSYSYTDDSQTTGFFSREIATLNASTGRQVKLRNLAFGCGFHASGPSISVQGINGAHGVMGLGRGPISFSSQLGKRFGNKFSYCLMDYTISPSPTSYLVIGEESKDAPIKKAMSFTPLQTNPLSPTFYYVGIETVSIDGVKLGIDPSVWAFDGDGNGGTIIDSGTTVSFLPDAAYRQILTAFKRRVRRERRVLVGPSNFGLCVNVSDGRETRLPRMSFGLLGGAIFSPPPRNYFIDVDDGVKCLALEAVKSPSGSGVIGNLMQQGYLFEFDRDESRLGFSRTGCSIPE